MTGTTEFAALEALDWKEKEYNMASYPIGPVEKLHRKMNRQLLKKDEVINRKDEDLKQKDDTIRDIVQVISEKFGSEGIRALSESGISDAELNRLPDYSTGGSSGN